MGYTFPDAVAGMRNLAEVLSGKPDSSYAILPADFYNTKKYPAFLVYRVGGNETSVFRTDRITIETWAQDLDDAQQQADQLRRKLVGVPHDTTAGLFDSVRVETEPTSIPQPDGFPAMVSATYQVDTRGT